MTLKGMKVSPALYGNTWIIQGEARALGTVTLSHSFSQQLLFCRGYMKWGMQLAIFYFWDFRPIQKHSVNHSRLFWWSVTFIRISKIKVMCLNDNYCTNISIWIKTIQKWYLKLIQCVLIIKKNINFL